MKSAFEIMSCLFTCILLPFVITAQPFKLGGQIFDKTRVPVENATIIILAEKKGTQQKVLQADRLGRFHYATIAGDYRIQVSAIGYEDTMFHVLLHKDIDTIVIHLQNMPGMLSEVAVTGKRMLIERKADKTIVNVDASVLSAGNNALEILEQSPGVKVDNGNILLKGKPGVTIFIDDKPAYLQGADLADFLQSLPATVLDKIEIMTNPSAQYDAAGTGGIINIKLKKGKVKGINGNVLLEHTQGKYGRSSQGINMNVRQNKLNLNLNLNNYNGTGFSKITTERKYDVSNDHTMTLLKQNSFMKVRNNRILIKAGVDYFASKKVVYGGVFSYLNNERKALTTLDGSQYYKNTNDSTLIGSNRQTGNTANIVANAYYKYLYDSLGRELLIYADYIRYKTENDFQNSSRLKAAMSNAGVGELYAGNVLSAIDIYTLKGDYNYPFNSQSKLAVGYKFSYANTINDAVYKIDDDTSHQRMYQSANRFTYKETIHAAYASYNVEKKRITMQLGLRAEYMFTHSMAIKDSGISTEYLRLFPTIFVGYKLNEQASQSLHFTYGRRIERPGYTDVNPFPVPQSRYSQRVGNPNLQPQLSDNFELNYLVKNTFTAGLFYSHIKNGMDETYTTQGSMLTYTTSNISTKNIYGASIDMSWTITKWWTVNPVILFTHTATGTILNGQPVSNKGNNVDISIIQQYSLSHGWNAEMNAGYTSKQVYPQYEQAPVCYIHAGISKKFAKDKWIIKLNVRDVFYSRVDQQNYTNMYAMSGYTLRRWDTRNITIAVGYKFNKGKKIQQVKNNSNAEESRRLKE